MSNVLTELRSFRIEGISVFDLTFAVIGTEIVFRWLGLPKYSGISIRGNQLFKDGKQIIAHEDAPHTIDLEYKQNPVGRDKMYDLLSRKYIGISIHDVAAYLQSNETHQTHLPIRPRIKVAHPIISREPLKRLQMDLVDMDKLRPNDPNYHYTLNVLDLNSKRLWSRPLTQKTGKSVAV